MKTKKIFKFKKGDAVLCSAFVFTDWLPNLEPIWRSPFFPTPEIIHTPADIYTGKKKVLVRQTLTITNKLFLVVGIKQIQTGYYSAAISSSSNWTGEYDGEPATFSPDKYHDVYVLEDLSTQRWRVLDYALEEDLRRKDEN